MLLGDSSVGKTAIIQRFMNEYYSTQFKSTVGVDFQHKEIMIDGKSAVTLQIWDTAG